MFSTNVRYGQHHYEQDSRVVLMGVSRLCCEVIRSSYKGGQSNRKIISNVSKLLPRTVLCLVMSGVLMSGGNV